MSSLKSHIPDLAYLLGTTSAALYERQRVLVRLMEAIDIIPGRGPGSGVRVTNRTVALLPIAVLATDSLSETYEQTITVGAAKSTGGRCLLTNTTVFSHALAAILSQEAIAAKIVDVSVGRTTGVVAVRYRSGRKTLTSEFKTPQTKRAILTIDATLAGAPLQLIAASIKSITERERSS